METTDNLQEIFDIVDIDDKVIGQASRKRCNSDKGIIHRAVFILIFNDKGKMLWQKRSATKDVDPGKWVTSASGHVLAGEDYEKTAVREAKEELGINLSLDFIGKFLFRYPSENEYSAVFRGYSNGPFNFDREEISEIRFMTIEDILKKEMGNELKLSKAVHYIIDSLSLL
jgi:isopentenyl-diphosphate delta-isomerase type 1